MASLVPDQAVRRGEGRASGHQTGNDRRRDRLPAQVGEYADGGADDGRHQHQDDRADREPLAGGNDGSLSTIHSNSSMEVFNRISTYAIQTTERLPMDATQLLIAGALDFVVLVRRHNRYQHCGGVSRYIESIREVIGWDGRVLSGEVFAPGPGRPRRRTRANLLAARNSSSSAIARA